MYDPSKTTYYSVLNSKDLNPIIPCTSVSLFMYVQRKQANIFPSDMLKTVPWHSITGYWKGSQPAWVSIDKWITLLVTY